MKKVTGIICMILMVGSLLAQPPGGMGGGQRRPPRHDSMPSQHENDKMWIEKMPEIPGLTLEQRGKLGDAIYKEWEKVEKQMSKKREYQIKLEVKPDLSEKDRKLIL